MGDIDILPTTFAEIQVKLHELVKTASDLAWFTYNFRDSMLQFQESADGRISNLERKIENLERQLNEIKEAAANPYSGITGLTKNIKSVSLRKSHHKLGSRDACQPPPRVQSRGDLASHSYFQ